MALTNKRYRYEIKSYTGDYLTDWTDVVDTGNDPQWSWPINNGVAECVVRLARPFNNFGEGVDVAFENRLNIYVQDKETGATDKLIYSGRLNEIRPHFGKDGEWVDVQFLGYASTLNDQTARNNNYVDFYIPPDGTPGTWDTITLPFFVAVDKFTQIDSSVAAIGYQPSVPNITGVQATLSGIVSTPENVVMGLMYADALDGSPGYVPTYQPGNIIASGVIPGKYINGGYATYGISFPAPIFNLDTSKNYFLFVAGSGISAQSADWPPGNSQFIPGKNYGDVWFRSTVGGAENRTDFMNGRGAGQGAGTLNLTNINLNISSTYTTTAPLYTNVDPTSIAQDLINNQYSGVIDFDSTNSKLTGQPITYQFNRQSYAVALQQLLAMSPPYYYYIVKPDNSLIFTQRNDAVLDHVLVLGQHISDAQPVHSVNDLKTRITLYGGSSPGNAELTYTDDRTYMQSRYTIKEDIIRDARVQLPATARQFTRDYFDYAGNPQTQIIVTVMDSNGDPNYGYDIESFIPGQRVMVVDPRTDASKNYYTTASNFNLDGDLLDAVDNYILAAPLQIMNIDYSPDAAILTLANQAITAPHKINDISSNLIQTQTGQSPLV